MWLGLSEQRMAGFAETTYRPRGQEVRDMLKPAARIFFQHKSTNKNKKEVNKR